MKAIVANRIFLEPETQEDQFLLERLKKSAQMDNPQYKKMEKLGKKPFVKVNGQWQKIPPVLRFYENIGGFVSFPSGCREALEFLSRTKDIEDRRTPGEDLPLLSFKMDLRDYQIEAVKTAIEAKGGVIEAPTGAGKTVIAEKIIQVLGRKTLILVHSKLLFEQWIKRLTLDLGIPKDYIGKIGNGQNQWGPVTVAIINSFEKQLDNIKELDKFGVLIVDECHRTPAKSFSTAADSMKCRYKFGFSATPFRSDGMDRFIDLFLGEKVAVIDARRLQDDNYILAPKVTCIETGFSYQEDYKCVSCGHQFTSEEVSGPGSCPVCIGGTLESCFNYARLIGSLSENEERNMLVAEWIRRKAEELENGEVLLVLSNRIDHLEVLREFVGEGVLLTGRQSSKVREGTENDVRGGVHRILFSTVALIGEGYDLPAISKVVLASPIKSKGVLKQVVGRALRIREGKSRPEVLDFIDNWVGILMNHFKHRKTGYNEIGATFKYFRRELLWD